MSVSKKNISKSSVLENSFVHTTHQRKLSAIINKLFKKIIILEMIHKEIKLKKIWIVFKYEYPNRLYVL